MTKDAHLVILHDETVDRTTDGEGKISEMTLDEAKDLDAGSWKSDAFAGERIPTLQEALAHMPDHIWLNLHLKGGRILGERVARVIVDENRMHQAFLACGSDAASAAKEIDPDILICNMERQGDRKAYIDETIRTGSEFIQLLSRRTDQPIDSDIAELKQHHIRINYCCTVDPDEANILFAQGVDFILTDKPAEMLEKAAPAGIQPAQYQTR
jgi:glycerophosphoryl diester phosphodiesterase